MSATTTRLTRYMGRRSVHGLAVLADRTPFSDVAQPHEPGTAIAVFCVLCGKEQPHRVCHSCTVARKHD